MANPHTHFGSSIAINTESDGSIRINKDHKITVVVIEDGYAYTENNKFNSVRINTISSPSKSAPQSPFSSKPNSPTTFSSILKFFY